MNFITLKELKKMVPVASEFKRVPGLKKILEDGIPVGEYADQNGIHDTAESCRCRNKKPCLPGIAAQ